MIDKTLKKMQPTSTPSASTGRHCKYCPRPVQPGLTRGMKPYDTCCRACGMSEGKEGRHDANCGGSSASSGPVVKSYTGPNPKTWLLDLVQHEDQLAAFVSSVFTKHFGGAPEGLVAGQVKELVEQHLFEPIGMTEFRLEDKQISKWIEEYSGQKGATRLQSANAQRLCRELLQDRFTNWFPDKHGVTASQFVAPNTRRVDTQYDFGRKLGEGSFGKVFSVTHKLTGEARVCKTIEKLKGKEGMPIEEILQEIRSMAQLDHPNVIKIYEYFEDSTSVSQIMEPCSGGELQDKIDDIFKKGQPRYSEAFVCDVMKQTLRALAFMHGHRFMHKDLKPQNIMLVDRESSSIKVIDFGLAELFTPDQKHSEAFGGTLLYMAPEVFEYNLKFKSDIWSAGVIFYNLLTGDYPFLPQWPLPPGKTMDWWQTQLQHDICRGDIKRHPRIQDSTWSVECKDLMMKMMIKRSDDRPDGAGCLAHQWFKKHEEKPPPLSVGVSQCLEAFAKQPVLKQAIFLLIAHMSKGPALKELRSIFTHFDRQNRGCLDVEDLRTVLHEAGMAPVKVERVVHAVDQDCSGSVDWTEFTAAALCVSVCGNHSLTGAAFAVIDKDSDGRASLEDFAQVFAVGDDRRKATWIKSLPAELEKIGKPGGDGKWTKEQFQSYMGEKIRLTAGDHLAAVG
eukprot:TRINITY_DN90820_c0_g1_i1.p1 TRINITY_DN90820_c0_g1~~TRINITY_DN90820_c0_g1_i1.p1  ORF type:complete len:757 (-),score=158.99 TRINITY_DN90820_c0_g1_i1:41-2065(-)